MTLTQVGSVILAEGQSARWTPNPAVPVQFLLWPLAGFLLGCLEFKSSATLVNSQLVASHQLGFLILRCLDCFFLII